MKKERKNYGIKPTLISFRRLLVHIRDYRYRFVSGLFVYSVASDFAFNLLFTISFLFVLGAGEHKDMALLVKGLLITSIGFVAVVVLLTAGQLLYDIAVARASGDLRKKVFRHFNSLPVRWYEDHHSGEAAARLTVDMQEAERAWGEPLRNMVATLISGFGSLIVMVILDWRFSLVIIPVSFLMFLLTTRFIEPVRKRSNEVQEAHEEVTKQLIDQLSSTRIVRLFNMSGLLREGLSKSIDKLFKTGMRRAHWVTAQEGVNSMAGMFTIVGGIVVGTIFVMQGWFSVAKMVAMVQMSNGISSMFYQLGTRLTVLQASLAGADRVLDVLDLRVEDGERPVEVPETANTLLSLSDVSFSYEAGTPVLQNVSVDIKRGETVAVVGGSGGGKSTLLKLISGFYPTGEGNVKLSSEFGGSVGAGRKNIAYVPQSNYLFSGTILENIQYGRPDAEKEDVVAAAKHARAHEFIQELPDGYNTMVGERGSQLSGGQRQRIAIARALLKNADLLLFDEATSSLDSRSERLMQEAIDGMMENRTSIVVAHRLSTVKHADRILVMEDGRIVEEGDHATLLEQDGRYAYYYNMQFA